MNEVESLRREVAELRRKIDATDDWANGIQHVLVAVLPFLLRGHPDAGKVESLLRHHSERFQALTAHPERVESPDETIGFKPPTANTEGGVVELTPAQDASEAFFTSYSNGITVSFYGDNHPAYAGNVVKAMASARHGYPKVCELFKDAIHHLDSSLQPVRNRSYEELIERLNESLVARVERGELSPSAALLGG